MSGAIVPFTCAECGAQFQESDGGICDVCRRLLCGSHFGRLERRVVCRTCVAQSRTAAETSSPAPAVSWKRREVAYFAEQLLNGRLSFEQFRELAPENPDDEDVAELLDLIEHQPKPQVFGRHSAPSRSHMNRVRDLIGRLARDGASEKS